MRLPFFTVIGLGVLSACGNGDDSNSFASRFAGDAAAEAARVAAQANDQADENTEEDTNNSAPNEIGLTDGSSTPPRLAFPSEYNRAVTVASALGNTQTGSQQTQNTNALDGQNTTPTDTPIAGETRFTGTYNAELYDNIDDPLATRVSTSTSAVTFDVNLATGRATGQSSNGRLQIGRAERPIQFGRFEGAVRFDGIPGVFDGSISATNAEADFGGDTSTTLFIGTFSGVAN